MNSNIQYIIGLLNMLGGVAYSIKSFWMGGDIPNNGLVCYILAFGFWTIATLSDIRWTQVQKPND